MAEAALQGMVTLRDTILKQWISALEEDEIGSGERMADFIESALGFNLWSMQRAIADAVDDTGRVTVRSCHSAGKSSLAARLTLAFLYTRPHSIVVTTAPTARQVQNILWRYINTACRSASRTLSGRALNTRYEIEPDWYAIGFKGSDDNSDAMQGFHSENLLVIADESAGIAESVFEGMEAILTGTGSRLLMIGNPTSVTGQFRRSFYKDTSLYKGFRISAYDTPNFTTFGITRDDMLTGAWRDKVSEQSMPYPALIDPVWVYRQIQLHGADSPYVVSRVDAEFPEDAGNVLIPVSWIENAEANAGTYPISEEDMFIAGVDVARHGEDETVICLRKGDAEIAMTAWAGNDVMESVGAIRYFLERHGASDAEVRVDVIGVGGGVVDRLHELEYNVIPINVGQASSDKESWMNQRQEFWWQLRERYRTGSIQPIAGREFDDTMKGQLSDVQYRYHSSYTKPVVEKKDDARKRGSKSPDRAEAQLLAFAEFEGMPTAGVRAMAARARRRPGRAASRAH